MIFAKIYELSNYSKKSWYLHYDPIPISYEFLASKRYLTLKATVVPSIVSNNSVPLFFKQFKKVKGKLY